MPLDDRLDRADLDNYLTGHGGEDQYPEDEPPLCSICRCPTTFGSDICLECLRRTGAEDI